jgi:hypothetical protein
MARVKYADWDDPVGRYDWDSEPVKKPPSTFWTEAPERVDILIRMYADGINTSLIAKRLGCTKNAVVGKASALNLRHASMKK